MWRMCTCCCEVRVIHMLCSLCGVLLWSCQPAILIVLNQHLIQIPPQMSNFFESSTKQSFAHTDLKRQAGDPGSALRQGKLTKHLQTLILSPPPPSRVSAVSHVSTASPPPQRTSAVIRVSDVKHQSVKPKSQQPQQPQERGLVPPAAKTPPTRASVRQSTSPPPAVPTALKEVAPPKSTSDALDSPASLWAAAKAERAKALAVNGLT